MGSAVLREPGPCVVELLEVVHVGPHDTRGVSVAFVSLLAVLEFLVLVAVVRRRRRPPAQDAATDARP